MLTNVKDTGINLLTGVDLMFNVNENVTEYK